MATLTKEQRDALPLSDFGQPGDRGFPITDQDDVDSAAKLIGKAQNPGMTKRRIIRIALRKKLSIPDAWKKEVNMSTDTMTDGDIRDALQGTLEDLTPDARHRLLHVIPGQQKVVYKDSSNGDEFQQDFEMDADGNPNLKGQPEKVKTTRRTSVKPVTMSARFSVAGNASGHMIPYEGEMFRLGNFPDKGFSMNEWEFDNVVLPAFRPYKFNAEHATKPDGTQLLDFLGAALGGVEKIWRVGAAVFGRSSIPDWIDSLTGGVVSHSFEFSPIDKTIIGCALTLDPRVTTAEAQAAFSRFSARQSGESGTRKPMNLITRIANWARGNPEAAKAAGMTPAELETFSAFSNGSESSAAADTPALQAQIDQLKASNATLLSQQTGLANVRGEDAAIKFAQDAIRAEKFAPTDEAWLTSLFRNSLIADGGGSVKFSGGALFEGPLCADLRKAVKDRPRHIFTEVVTGAENLKIIFSDPAKSKEETASKQADAYLAGTGTKDRVLKARKEA